MTLHTFIENYGYLAVLVGTFIEGETIVILAGFAVQLGYLELPLVVAAAIAGSFSGDQLWYYMGRHWGPRIIARRLSWQEGAEKVYAHLRRHQNFLILTFRFYYGLRNVTPFAVGSAQVGRVRFFVLNLIGAVIWAIALTYIGKLSGEAAELFLTDIHRYELAALGVLVALGIGIWAITLIRHRRHARRRAQEAGTNPARNDPDAPP